MDYSFDNAGKYAGQLSDSLVVNVNVSRFEAAFQSVSQRYSGKSYKLGYSNNFITDLFAEAGRSLIDSELKNLGIEDYKFFNKWHLLM